MHSIKMTVVLGALLSASLLMAQQSDPSQAAPEPQTAQEGAPAQPGMRHAPNPEREAAHLAKQLGLSDGQRAQIEPILASRTQQMESLRADNSLEPRDRRAKARDIMQDSNAKIEAVLNDSQKQQFEQMLAQRREHRRGGEEQSPQGSPQD